jgi:hypothetical protein
MSNEKQTEAERQAAINCVCIRLKCYKLNCKYRSNPREFCPDPSGPVDWRGRKINEQRKTD